MQHQAESGDGKSYMRGLVEVDVATPVSSASSSQKTTCLRRKKKLRSREADGGGGSGVQAEISGQESEWEVTKRLDFDDVSLSGEEPAEPTELKKPRRVSQPNTEKKTKKKRRVSEEKHAVVPVASGTVPIRNTCILESPLDHKRSQRKRRVYGVRRGAEPEHSCKPRKRSVKRAMPFALCSLQRMFAS